jgi:hypothetical protein
MFAQLGAVAKHGLRFNGIIYELESTTAHQPATAGGLARWAVRGRKAKPVGLVDRHWDWGGGIYLVRTMRAIVIATFDEGKGHSGEVCRAAVDGLSQFMTDYSC